MQVCGFSFFNYFNVYLLFEREIQSMKKGGAERERERERGTESEAGSRL